MLSDVLLSVTDAALSYAIDKLDPAETIKSWLKREPARLAFQKALARAYTAVARQHPKYVTSLFDQSFLEKEAAPVLAKFLVRGQHPDPAALAQAWGKSLGQEKHSEFCQRATKPAGDFLAWLEAELKAELVFQPLFDSRALDSLPRLEEQITKLTAELTHSLETALKQASEYEKVFLSIGGDVRDSIIVVGDNNQVNVSKVYYSGQFTSLNDYYIPPDSVFQRVRVDEFVGREWLIAKVDAFLNDPGQKSGAFVLVGDAGVGKTSFMAHLVKERGYLHFFSELAPGNSGLQRALQSLGSQLVTRYQIDPYKDRDTLTQTAVFPDFLERLMRLAAQGLCNGEKIVIVCDALDEAGTFPDGNVLGLPNVLPDGVYLILSQRPINVKLPNLTLHSEKLEAQGESNLQDMETYLGAVAKRPEIAGQIRAREYPEAFFIRTLKEKSQGVWMYLHYILREIESGSRAPLELENLPIGLVGYYADYWDDWRNGRRGRGEGQRKWDELYAPLLTTLAAVQEPIAIEQLIEWSSIEAKPREVCRLLNETWRAFIAERETPKGRLYFPYHLSFRDFVTGKVDFEKLSVAQGNLVRDLAEQTVEAHGRIVKAFEYECKGELEKLVERDYPRLHLCAHLDGAKEYNKLVHMLTEGDANVAWAEAKYKKDETYAGYINDLIHVWHYAGQINNYGLLVRCMLIENSIHSIAENIPPGLIAELGKSGIWSYSRCLTTIRQKSSSKDQAESLSLLIPNIPPALYHEVLDVVCEIEDELWRPDALLALAPYLPDKLKVQALANTRRIKSKSCRVSAVSALAPYLQEELKTQLLVEALEAAHEIKDEHWRFIALSELAPHLTDELKTQAVAIACEIKYETSRFNALSALIPYLQDELKTLALGDALAAARKIQLSGDRASTLYELVPQLPDQFKREALGEALTAAREIRDNNHQASVLSKLVPHLPAELQAQVFAEVLAKTRGIEDEKDRANVLSELVPQLPDQFKEEVLTEALVTAYKIQDENDRACTLLKIASHQPDELKVQVLIEVLAVAREIEDEENRANVLSELVPQLPDQFKGEVLAEALVTAYKIQDENDRACTLLKLASHISGALKAQILIEVLAAVREIRDEEPSINALSALSPQLPDELIAQVFTKVCEIQDGLNHPREMSSILSTLAPHLPDNLKSRALAAAREIWIERYRAIALSSLAPILPDNLKSRALVAAYEIHDNYGRAIVLAALMPHLPDKLKAQVLVDALAAACKIQDDGDRAIALSSLAPILPDNLKSRALTAACKIQDGGERASALSSLAPILPDNLKSRALAAAREIWIERYRAIALSSLAPHLPDNLKSRALAAAREIQDEYHCVCTLSTLAQHLPDELKAQVLVDALAVASKIQDSGKRAIALSSLAPILPDNLKSRALAAAREIQDEYHCVCTLSTLAQHLPDELKAQVLIDAFAIARKIKYEPYRALALSALAPYLPEDLKIQALASAYEIRDDSDRASTLIDLSPYLGIETKKQIFQEVIFISRSLERLMYRWKKIGYDGLEDKIILFLRFTSKKNRKKGLGVTGAMADALSFISKRNISSELFRSITDVTRWWP